MKLILLTLVRKGELVFATWDEVDFINAIWTIPASRMKCGRPHDVYLSRQGLDIMVALRTCAGNSPYLLPSRYEPDQPMSRATFNRVTTAIFERAQQNLQPLQAFTVHDLRRTGSTLLNEVGFDADWTEKCLAHVDRRTSRRVYNVAEYAHVRTHMLQEWADMIDAWVAGKKRFLFGELVVNWPDAGRVPRRFRHVRRDPIHQRMPVPKPAGNSSCSATHSAPSLWICRAARCPSVTGPYETVPIVAGSVAINDMRRT
ncbi:tyrosine-type recombinase/integrase [Caulobacter sp. DWR1-3-2b1]|uniref:tyrosine-type recombinase/integrase n=1 Tax=Caulobacter sp. DWR1-3-2b1 TaxID=2804670 RepID=UPI003CF5B88A